MNSRDPHAPSRDKHDEYHFDARQFVLWLPVYLVVAMALYILSAGPLYWVIYNSFYVSHGSWLQILYLPLVWLSSTSEIFAGWMDWYIGLWIF